MTLLQARKIVLKSIAQELSGSYLGLYGRLEKGWLAPQDASAVKLAVDELESLMAYVRFEAENLAQESLKTAVKEVDTLWQGAQNGR